MGSQRRRSVSLGRYICRILMRFCYGKRVISLPGLTNLSYWWRTSGNCLPRSVRSLISLLASRTSESVLTKTFISSNCSTSVLCSVKIPSIRTTLALCEGFLDYQYQNNVNAEFRWILSHKQSHIWTQSADARQTSNEALLWLFPVLICWLFQEKAPNQWRLDSRSCNHRLLLQLNCGFKTVWPSAYSKSVFEPSPLSSSVTTPLKKLSMESKTTYGILIPSSLWSIINGLKNRQIKNYHADPLS